MRLNYLGRYVFSRICSFPVEKHLPTPRPSTPRVAGRAHLPRGRRRGGPSTWADAHTARRRASSAWGTEVSPHRPAATWSTQVNLRSPGSGRGQEGTAVTWRRWWGEGSWGQRLRGQERGPPWGVGAPPLQTQPGVSPEAELSSEGKGGHSDPHAEAQVCLAGPSQLRNPTLGRKQGEGAAPTLGAAAAGEVGSPQNPQRTRSSSVPPPEQRGEASLPGAGGQGEACAPLGRGPGVTQRGTPGVASKLRSWADSTSYSSGTQTATRGLGAGGGGVPGVLLLELSSRPGWSRAPLGPSALTSDTSHSPGTGEGLPGSPLTWKVTRPHKRNPCRRTSGPVTLGPSICRRLVPVDTPHAWGGTEQASPRGLQSGRVGGPRLPLGSPSLRCAHAAAAPSARPRCSLRRGASRAPLRPPSRLPRRGAPGPPVCPRPSGPP